MKIKFEDNQIHSTYSDGKYSLREIFEYNNLHDKLDLIITDHVDKNTDWFPRYASEIKKLRKEFSDFKVRIGCEVKILDDGTLNTTKKILAASEVVLGSVHHFDGIKTMTGPQLLEREFQLTKLLAQSKQIDILGHPFSMVQRFFNIDPPAEYIKEVYDLCVKNKIKFEYNNKHALVNIRLLVKKEIKRGNINNFSFGSDMHKDLKEIGDATFDLADPIPVLVTGAGAGVGQSIIKSIKLSKVRTKLIVADADPLAAGLYRGSAAYIIPRYDSKNYINELIRICKKEKVRFIFSGTDIELPALAKNRKKIESQTSATLIVSDKKSIEIADDKWKTVEFLKKNSFPYPDSCLKNEAEEFSKKSDFPLIVKPRVGARSVGFSVVGNKKEFLEKLASIQEPIIQEYLSDENEEYTCSTFFYKGKNYGVMTSKRWLRNGDTYKAVVAKNKGIEDFIAKVGSKLNLYGPCNFQLRKDGRKIKIFEINCRFSGTTGMASFLGFNVANWLIQKELFGRPLKKLSFKESYMFRYWNEMFVDKAHPASLNKKGFLENHDSDLNII